MIQFETHPTVEMLRRRPVDIAPAPFGLDELRRLCLDLGAADVGFVDIERPEVADQRDEILALLPGARTLIAFVLRTNRESLRTPPRSVANLEFHHVIDRVNETARAIVAALETRGARALNPAGGFPMEMDRWGHKTWLISHKPIAVAAGLGKMGIHRNVIHPRFGSFVLLGTVVTDLALAAASRPLEYNPCVECKLCVAACPTGAIHADGGFDFNACYTHNYREFMGGFADWVETVADSKDAADYRRRVSDAETVSLWQSLGFGPNYKAAYCVAVCPAGEDVMTPFLEDRPAFVAGVVRPLQSKPETVYVLAGSDAERHVARRFPHKRVQRVHGNLRPRTVDAFLSGAPRSFQPGLAAGVELTVHFTFTGEQSRQATIAIQDGAIAVDEGHVGKAQVGVTVDAQTWLRIVNHEAGVLSAVLRGKLKLRGAAWRLREFGRCFVD